MPSTRSDALTSEEHGDQRPGGDAGTAPHGSTAPRSDAHSAPGKRATPPWWHWVLLLSLVLVGGVTASTVLGPESPEELDFSAFVARVEDGEVEQVLVDEQGRARGELADGTRFETVIPTELAQDELLERLLEQGVTVQAEPPTGDWWTPLLWLAPVGLIGLVLYLMYRGARGQMSQLQGVGESKADIIETERPQTTFDDVAGYEGVREEVGEIVDYLRDPERFHRVGARGPGGVLMLGPAGTGKTLIARAIAGEAEVPFISVSGSEFVEMLVGVGASRVRDLFAKARERQPAIVFIDELDSIGRKRGTQSTIGSNNEQEQTLNQLLKELDGFDAREGVVILAATNRPEMLDDALLRPGRFDRHVEVDLPSQAERVEILRVHCRARPLAAGVDLERVARGTPGFSGAKLENLVNEAAITAVRADRGQVTQVDFDVARDRMLLGRRQDPDILRPDEKQRVAVHESGHALVATLTEESDPVTKVTILPSQRALGTTEQLPVDERRLATEAYLHDTLAVRLGGRVAEMNALGDLSTGAAHDLASATELASRMVREFGLSEKLGPVGYQMGDEPGGVPGLQSRPFAEDTQRQVDEEVARLLREAEARAQRLITDHQRVFDRLIERLLEDEVVEGEEIHRMLGQP